MGEMNMDTTKRRRLEEAGFRIGTVAEFLGLTLEENEMVETRVAQDAADMKRDELADMAADQPGR